MVRFTVGVMRPRFTDRCVFGLASMQEVDTAREPLAEWIGWVGRHARLALSTRFETSYESLARRIRDGEIDVAWLPPVVYVMLERAGVVDAMVSNHRAGQAAFHGVLLVRSEEPVHTLDGLRGMRAAWVDPLSASGYVIPRIQLALLGVDPRTTFREERFVGSHDAAVRAVAKGEADVAATFARVDGAGNVTSGSWSALRDVRADVRVFWTFDAIPSDVIAARKGYPDELRERLTDALVASTRDAQAAKRARRLFGVEEFRRGHMKSYSSLRRAIEKASAGSLIDELRLASL